MCVWIRNFSSNLVQNWNFGENRKFLQKVHFSSFISFRQRMHFVSKFRWNIDIFERIRAFSIYKVLTKKKGPKFNDVIGDYLRGPKIEKLFSLKSKERKLHYLIGPWIYPRGSLVIRPSVRSSFRPSLNISEIALTIFLKLYMKLGHHKGTKVTEPDFWKKILGGHKWGKTPILGAFLKFFVHISASSH